MIRRFETNINCATCAKKINKVFSQYKDIEISINFAEKIVTIESDENQYPSFFIINLIKKAGYEAEEI